MQRNAGDYVKSWGAALVRGVATNPEFTVVPYLPKYVCQIWLRSDGRVKKKGGVQTDRQRETAALYSRWLTGVGQNPLGQNPPHFMKQYYTSLYMSLSF